MKNLIPLLFLISIPALASVIGVSTHPLRDSAKVLSAEMTGYMSQQNEMGAGLRYTQGVDDHLFDVTVAGAQNSRSFTMGGGLDLQLLNEDVNRPRVSFKPFFRQENFDDESSSLFGVAPSLRKGVAIGGQEFFPFIALPNGMRVQGDDQEVLFSSALSFGGSMTIPESQERLVISLEANKSLGSSSDYVGALVSWVWN